MSTSVAPGHPTSREWQASLGPNSCNKTGHRLRQLLGAWATCPNTTLSGIPSPGLLSLGRKRHKWPLQRLWVCLESQIKDIYCASALSLVWCGSLRDLRNNVLPQRIIVQQERFFLMFKLIPSRKEPVGGSSEERHGIGMSHNEVSETDVGRCGFGWSWDGHIFWVIHSV